jgi:hypothetical protein
MARAAWLTALVVIASSCSERALEVGAVDPSTPDLARSDLARSDLAGCSAAEDCGPTGAGNGLDDDCNGKVDDTCHCTLGDVERCFGGPAVARGVGACTDGTQTCTSSGWGDCVGAIVPTDEICNGVDDDCDGLVDDGLTCDGLLACPTTVPDVYPYSQVTFSASDYFHGDAMRWHWNVEGGPCDQLFLTTTGTPPHQSFITQGVHGPDLSLYMPLSGDYTITLQITDTSGTKWGCKWVQHVNGPGVRFELCWDTTGSSDLDLHVHRPNSTTDFFETSTGDDSPDDCDYRTCGGASATGVVADWGSASPSLDLDNINMIGGSENINIVQPHDGDRFRALIHYFKGNKVTHPLVNIYCGGHIKATYGQAPDQVQGFDVGNGWANGDMWRVADVAAVVDGMGMTSDCTVTALHPLGQTSGYRVGHDNNISYEGD